MSDHNVFGERLKETRESLLITQQELADKVGVSRQNVSNYEKGRNTPTLEMTGILADHLGVTVDYLMGRTDHKDYMVIGKEQLPRELVDDGLDAVSLFRGLVNKNGGISLEVQQELLRLLAEAKVIRDKERNRQ